ncbi:MAG: protein phosphatase 2C domain-containing protein [Myxococcales bacterium]|nr:protein phosphatase 2C domain-containing protein [Myxococcales bacterium]MCB9568459.1 protein phosphatase 2C domain-containing protein [Myxococcales bacterium]MCB9702054.1 protein phosphatase 2C domain-containing protein [Myxococcales bacterium]
MEIKYWAATDVGRKRSHNEDNFLVDKTLNLFVVADGMGGHASGEVASAMAVHTIREVIFTERHLFDNFVDDDPAAHIEISTLLEYAVHAACASIFRKAQQEPEKRGMGTTVVVLLIIGRRGFIAYVGDSRIYLLRNGIVYPLTEDHSLMNELIRSGKLNPEEFAGSPYANFKNAMTRAVGVHEHVEVDILDFEVLPGDSFLLCSDGLYEYLEGSDIASNLALPNIEEIPGRFIDLANSRGGKDNITALVVQLPQAADTPGRAAELNFTIETLRRLPLMRQLSYQQLCKVMTISRMRPFERGEAISREGTPGGELCAVLEGDIRLTRHGREYAIIHAGQHFGEIDLIDTTHRTLTAAALSDGRLLVIERRDFYDILHRDAHLAVKLLWNLNQELSKRLLESTDALLKIRAQIGIKQPEAPEVDVDIIDEVDVEVAEITVVKKRDKDGEEIEELEASELVEV